MLKTSRAVAVILSMLLCSCAEVLPGKVITPYPDEPDRQMRISISFQAYRGVSWSLGEDGLVTDFGGPLGGNIKHPFSRVIIITNTEVNLATASDVYGESVEVKALYEAAKDFCQQIGYTRNGRSGAYVGTQNGELFFIDICGPE